MCLHVCVHVRARVCVHVHVCVHVCGGGDFLAQWVVMGEEAFLIE